MGINDIEAVEVIAQRMGLDSKDVKKVRSDKGLIERVESSKVVLTEDNKQLLVD